MRPYFARRVAQKPPHATDVDPAALRAAHAALVASTRRFLPGGQLTRTDLLGVTKRIAATFNVPVEDVVTAVSTPV